MLACWVSYIFTSNYYAAIIIILRKGCCEILETFALAIEQDYNTFLVLLQYDSNSYRYSGAPPVLLPEASFGLWVLSLPTSVCLCVCVCGNHELVRVITRDHPFKLGSPNLDQRCKTTWLRSLLFYRTIDLDLQGQIELQNQNLPHFELVHAITHQKLKLQFPNL